MTMTMTMIVMNDQTKEIEVATDDLLQLLGKAITCAVLGKAGPQRSRQMGVLLRDERVETLARVPGFSTHAQVGGGGGDNALVRLRIRV